MMRFTNTNEGFTDLLQKHYSLDFALRDDNGKVFFSDWSCSHPFMEEYSIQSSLSQDTQSYVFYSDDLDLNNSISKFHEKCDHIIYDQNQILPGDGSTGFIATFCLWLLKQDITEVYYVPPIYYTFNYFFELFRIKGRPIAGLPIFEANTSIKLPNKKTVLIICDPVWYIGQSIKKEVIEEIKSWQEKTGSIIFVDGSFQYTKWYDQENFENTSLFNTDLTFRLICPTKYLATHGYRFSYLLLPSDYYNEFLYMYANNIGSTCIYNLLFAKHALNLMLTQDANNKLRQHIVQIYNSLIKTGNIETTIIPNSGYFIFAKILKEIPEFHFMDQDFFLLKNYPDYIRINLLGGNILAPLLIG